MRLVGDFNFVLSPEKDDFNYMHLNNPKARQKVIEMMLDLDLIDCWREDHMEDRKYTWLKKNLVKQARLDFIFISKTIHSKVDKTDILPGYRTDHSLIFISVVLDKIENKIQ